MAEDLETLTAKIKSRLGEQNQILRNCVTKYQDSNKTNNEIAERISTITKELTLATDNLKQLGLQHNQFRAEVDKKTQSYINEKKTMEDSHAKEREEIETAKQTQLDQAKADTLTAVQEAERKQEDIKQKLLEGQKSKFEEDSAKKQEEFDQATQRSEEHTKEKTQELDEFKQKLENDKTATDAEQKKLEDLHTADLATAKNNEEKLLKMQNEINRLTEEQKTSNTKHVQDLEEFKTKAQSGMVTINTEHAAAITDLQTKLKQHETEALATAETVTVQRLEELKQSYEGQVSAQKDEGGARIDVLNTQLEVCNKKYETTQKLYEDNTAQIKQIENDMKMAEEAAGQALLASVDKLSEENTKLQAQISEMTESQPRRPPLPSKIPPPLVSPPDNMSKRKNDPGDPEIVYGSRGSQGVASQLIAKYGLTEIIKLTNDKDALGGLTAAQVAVVIDGYNALHEHHQQIENGKLALGEGETDTHAGALKKYEENDGLTGMNTEQKNLLKTLWGRNITFEQYKKKGGYKHGKSSKKKNKRSLESKLTAKKFSLKKRSKRGKIKGKSKKRRKSIKIRI